MNAVPRSAGATAGPPTQLDDPIEVDDSQAGPRAAGGSGSSISEGLHRAIIREAFDQLNRGLDASDAGKVTFQPRVVDALAATRPADKAALMANPVPGLSDNQRKVHATAIMVALGQVAAYVASGAPGGVHGFALDMEPLWARKRAKRPASGGPGGPASGGGGGGRGAAAPSAPPDWADDGPGTEPVAKLPRTTQAEEETMAAAAAMIAADDWDDDW
jgi:hypothetical protein